MVGRVRWDVPLLDLPIALAVVVYMVMGSVTVGVV